MRLSSSTYAVCAALFLPLAYVATEPFVWAYHVKPEWRPAGHAGSILTPATWISGKIPPPWLISYSRPYIWLQATTPLKVPLEKYKHWCFEVMSR